MASGSGVEALADESTIASPVVRRRGMEKVQYSADILDRYTFPVPIFARARLDKRKKRLMPQVIAHRGYRAKFPENSLLAFSEAVRSGANALETDVHLTKDNVVVLSHDEHLKKFGHPNKIVNCTWDEIEHMKTLAKPHVPMLRLVDLLDYLLQPDRSDIWLLLDVKSDNQADDAMRSVASTIAGIDPLPTKPWTQRILLGLWASRYLPLAAKFLPGFSVVHVGFHLSHARRNIWLPNVGSVMLVQTLLAPGGRRFLRECQAGSGTNIAWTVNDRDKAQWCARRGLDGMITDDPASMVKVLELYDHHDPEPAMPVSIWGYADVFVIFALVNGLFWYFKRTMKLDDGAVTTASRQ